MRAPLTAPPDRATQCHLHVIRPNLLAFSCERQSGPQAKTSLIEIYICFNATSGPVDRAVLGLEEAKL